VGEIVTASAAAAGWIFHAAAKKAVVKTSVIKAVMAARSIVLDLLLSPISFSFSFLLVSYG
jgi:hypothetical protein